MNLLAKLSNHPNRIAVSTPNASITYEELVLHSKQKSQSFFGKKIVITEIDIIKIILSIVSADGVADLLCLMSPKNEQSTLAKVTSLVRPDIFISHENDQFTEINPSHSATHCVRSNSTRWVLSTSGTNGQPKLVEQSFLGLTRTINSDLTKMRNARWGLLYEPSRFAGLQVILQSLVSGAHLLASSLEEPLERQIKFLIDGGCTHLSASPTMWRKILMCSFAGDLKLTQISLGGEIVDNSLLNQLKSKFKSTRISHIFASTEAGVAFSVSDGLAGFPAKFLSEPPKGVEIRIEKGRLWVKNPHCRKNYLGTNIEFSKDGWVDTGDLVEIREDRVHFIGRSDGTINIGGDKVCPEEVEQKILTHPLVAQVRVYGKSNPITGALVVADIVVKQGANKGSDLRKELLHDLKKTLPKHKVPAFLNFVEELESNSNGKLKRGC